MAAQESALKNTRGQKKTPEAELLQKIQKQQARVAVIGVGYVGLPLALAFAEKNFSVTAFDIDKERVQKINKGESYIKLIDPRRIKEALQKRTLSATAEPQELKNCDCIVICVPTPLTEEKTPDLNFIENTAKTIGRFLKPGRLIILESTTYPGTTREIVQPILEKEGLIKGRDFFLAYSPEREDPGAAGRSVGHIPKVVGADDPASAKLAQALYQKITKEVVAAPDTKTAEAAKMLENIYRAVNIALVNELKMLFNEMGINIWEVIRASSTKPFGFQAFYPGPGWGGHCIPIDPFYLSWKAKQYGFSTHFIELAGEINAKMPEYVVGKIMAALNSRGKALKEARIMVLGVAYKPDVDDMRETPALPIFKLLQRYGAQVSYNDPYVPSLSYSCDGLEIKTTSQELSTKTLAQSDCVLIVTAHSSYDPNFILNHAPLIIDTRNLIKTPSEKVILA